MKKTFFTLVLLVSFQILWGQQNYYKIGNLGQTLTPKDPNASKVNEVYIDTTWRKSSIVLYNSDQKLDNLFTKYEVKGNLVEVLVDKEVKVLSPKAIKTMTTYGRLDEPHNFVNGKDFFLNGVPLNILIEVLTAGKISIYKQHSFWVKPAGGNAVLGIAGGDEIPMKEDHLFYSTGSELIKMPKKKKILALFGDKAPQVETFMKTKNLGTNSESDLVRIFSYYNAL